MRLVPAVAIALLGFSAPALASASLASFVAATHWNPCYWVNASLPSLLDGAAALARMGTTSIKLIMDPNPAGQYPWHTDWSAILANVHSLQELAATPIFDAVFRGSDAWDYSAFAIITYRFTSPSATWNYWCEGFSPSDASAETSEFMALTQHFLSAFSGSGKVFMLEHWEGDWSARCGGYDPSKIPDPAVQQRMIEWLSARQAGVDAGRAAWCAERKRAGVLAVSFDCADGRAVHAAAGVSVFHASEVNLVWTSMQNGFPNNVLNVLPHVSLDMVSYSSYDTQFRPEFGAALDFISAHHNKTLASPTPDLFVAEYGVAQNEASLNDLLSVYQNVNAFAFSAGPSDAARASHTFAWELFDNEVDESPQFPGGRCNGNTGPEFNASKLHGFWLIRPDGSQSPSFTYLQGLINGSVPFPAPVPHAVCSYVQDQDVDNPESGEGLTGVLTKEACCAACGEDVKCTSAVWTGTQCWTKNGGTPVPKKGAVNCVKAKAGEEGAGRIPRFPASAFKPEWVARGGL
jgi:hypothetical protein